MICAYFIEGVFRTSFNKYLGLASVRRCEILAVSGAGSRTENCPVSSVPRSSAPPPCWRNPDFNWLPAAGIDVCQLRSTAAAVLICFPVIRREPDLMEIRLDPIPAYYTEIYLVGSPKFPFKRIFNPTNDNAYSDASPPTYQFPALA